MALTSGAHVASLRTSERGFVTRSSCKTPQTSAFELILVDFKQGSSLVFVLACLQVTQCLTK